MPKSQCTDGVTAPNVCDSDVDLRGNDGAGINVRAGDDYYSDEEEYVCCAEQSIITESSCSDRPDHV